MELDLVISSHENTVNDVQVLEHLGSNDHNILVWNLICEVGRTLNQAPTRKYQLQPRKGGVMPIIG
jgi:hypothetical protein